MAEKEQAPEKNQTNEGEVEAGANKESEEKPSLPEKTRSNQSSRDWLQEYFSHALGISNEPPAESLLEEVSFEGIAKYIASDKCQKIVTMAGAGISTSAGIPDFRSPGTGLYDNLQKYDLPDPQAVFSIDYFKERPEAFFTLAKELAPGSFKPTPCHYFLKLLDEKKKLLMHFTQNIDTLERVAGLDGDKIVEAHGTFHTSHCLNCRKEYTYEWTKDKIFSDLVPRCVEGECGGIVKPDIVFFGEALPDRFSKNIGVLQQCDLLIILGTSLVVQPFASLTSRVRENTPRLYINLEKTGVGSSHPIAILMFGGGFNFDGEDNIRDVFWQGTCDDGCYALADLLGWGPCALCQERKNECQSAMAAQPWNENIDIKAPSGSDGKKDELRQLVKDEHARIDKEMAANQKAEAEAKKSPAKTTPAKAKTDVQPDSKKSPAGSKDSPKNSNSKDSPKNSKESPTDLKTSKKGSESGAGDPSDSTNKKGKGAAKY